MMQVGVAGKLKIGSKVVIEFCRLSIVGIVKWK